MPSEPGVDRPGKAGMRMHARPVKAVPAVNLLILYARTAPCQGIKDREFGFATLR